MINTTNWILNIDHETKPVPEPSNVLQIKDIAKNSPAADLGLEIGDFFVSINGQAALSAKVIDILLEGGDVQYEFYLSKQNKSMTVKAQGVPLGFKTEATSEGILKKYKTAKRVSGFEGIMQLWERKAYGSLKQVGSHLDGKGMKARLLSKVFKNPILSLIEAICEIEAGQQASGYKKLDAFQEKDMRFYTSDITSLVLFYQALRVEKSDPESFKEQMWTVMQANQDSKRMVELADKYEIGYVPKGQRLGSQYKFNWELDGLEGAPEKLNTYDLIQALKPGQILPICFMAGYRGNGPYNDTMKVYHAMYPYVKDRLLPLCVMTTIDTKRVDRPHWFEAEEALIRAGIPINVLHDPNAYFWDDYLTGAPDFIGLDNTGTVVWDFTLENSYDYWEMLSQTARK